MDVANVIYVGPYVVIDISLHNLHVVDVIEEADTLKRSLLLFI